ncbi:hypothetical protein Bca101_085725 [Brassica carinata]
MGPAPEQYTEWTVKHLMLPSGTDWDRAIIQRVLPHEEERILSLKPSKLGAPDKLIWLGTSSGIYSTKTGYIKALERSEENRQTATTVEVDWIKNIWRLQTSLKIELFLWKIFQGALPVGDPLALRNISHAQTCPRCDTIESINHLFLHCEFAHNVWKLAPCSTCVDARGLLDLTSAWAGLCSRTCLPPVGIASGPLAPWILWSLWLARNNRIFNNRDSTPEEVITRAISSAQEWLREQQAETTPSTRPPTQRPPDPTNATLLHSDGAWRADLQLAGLGWTIGEGNQTGSYMAHCHFVNSSLIAEGLALREALSCCITKGIRCVLCKSDSLQFIRAINQEAPNSEIYGIVSDILNLVYAFDFVSFVWTQRSENKAADALAKQALLNEALVPTNRVP